VRAAAQLDAVDGGLAAGGVRGGVVKLDESPLRAVPAVLGDERAAPAVTDPHGAADRCRHMT
jgi:hypothetical protein